MGNFGGRKLFPTKYFTDKVTNKDVTVKFKISINSQDSIRPNDVTLRYYLPLKFYNWFMLLGWLEFNSNTPVVDKSGIEGSLS